MAEDTITLTARCLCKANVFTAAIQSSTLPLKASCCHCNSCRHVTGALCFVDVEWPKADETLSALQKYSFSSRKDIFFCATCSSPMFCRGTTPGETLRVATGVLENGSDLVEYAQHTFVGDTLDGGASMWLRKNHRDGTAIKRWKARSDENKVPNAELAPDWPQSEAFPAPASEAFPSTTPIRCHCGGVNLVLRNAVDLKSVPIQELPWYVDPVSFKYLASTDVCDSCRLSFGSDLINWTFAGLDHIDFPPSVDGTPTGSSMGAFPRTVSALKKAVSAAERDPRLGTLALYQSSPEVERYFCRRCAAFVFYAVDERPDMVDIAVGLLEHPSGARAEGLLSWNYGGWASWMEDVAGGWREGFVKGVLEECEEWRIQRGYPKCWRRVIWEQSASTA